MEQDPNRNKGRIYAGLILVAVGILLFASKFGVPLPEWLFSWPVGLIALGIIISAKHNFNNPGGFILILIGGLHLMDHLNPGYNLHSYLLPAMVLGIGIILLFAPKKSACKHGGRWRRNLRGDKLPVYQATEDEKKNEEFDYIDSVTVFGAIRKSILSKSFRGGEVTCFMGGAEFNLTQADIHGTVILEVTQVFGATKIIVPASWYIKTEVITVFGGIEDKRPVIPGNTDPDKVLVLKGTTVFGGIDIRSY